MACKVTISLLVLLSAGQAFNLRPPGVSPNKPGIPSICLRPTWSSHIPRSASSTSLLPFDGFQPPLKDPVAAYESAVKQGEKKANEPAPIIFLLGIQAGLQVGIGAAMAVTTMAGVPGIQAKDPGLAKLIYGFCGLPCGLLMTATMGTMLFTGNTAVVSVALMEKKIKLQQLVKTWVWSYLGNMVGAGFLAALCTYAGVFSSSAAAIASVAASKTAMPFGVAVARGILCNWLVTTAVWIAQAAADLVSKATAIVLIITIFASLGFEHSVANMFVGPFGALNGGPSFLHFFLRNLIPVTIGNIIAGVVMVAFANYLSFGSGGKRWRSGSKD
ncbi:hypothetical protein NSK_007027 [Nannochloropsis salina CCMP1776]|uniref:Formate/nitrite transporter n=1 Tax=Nannochloropsis salina CCMP1776 TaxID=1027361 RepID=A0A4D9CZ24_9STRA|nr:hypothetical protein NSK_007027 [Nannochloropsis salina CCMP1776]|eukprot:TFJ81779.1 hypothetical protein NSK_007027 [Nannochloropsis salina CCMP1776]